MVQCFRWCLGFLTQAPKLAPQTAKQIEEGYIFMDWLAIPQLHIASDDSSSELKSPGVAGASWAFA